MLRGYRGRAEGPSHQLGTLALSALSGGSGGDTASVRWRENLVARLRRDLAPRIPPSILQELDALRSESDLQLFQEGLFQLGARQEQEGRIETAVFFYQALQNPGIAQDSPSAVQARLRLEGLEGRGSLGGRAELLLRGLARQAADPSTLLAMGAAGAVFRVTRLATLSRLASASNPGLLTRLFGAGRLASLAGFAAEAPAFAFASRLGAQAFGHPQDWSAGALRRDLASSYFALGGLRLAGWAHGAVAGRMYGANPSRWIGLQSQAAMLGGILLGHGLERWAGLRPEQDGATTLADSLALLLQFHVAGRLSGAAFGPRWAAWERGLDLQAETIGKAGASPPTLAPPAAALAGAGAPALSPNEPITPPSFMMSASGRSGGRGPRELSPVLKQDPANHNHQPIEAEVAPEIDGPPRTAAADHLQPLPRGGVMLRTEAGVIQFGVPMWTNKDAFELFLQAGGARLEREEIRRTLPTLYVFDLDYVARHDGLLPADFMQYMYFVNRGLECTLLAPDAATGRRLRDFLDLSYQGPKERELTEQVQREYTSGAVGLPDMGAEIHRGFSSPPPETLRNVAHFDEQGAFFWQGVAIRKLAPLRYEVLEQGRSLGELDLRAFPLPLTAAEVSLTPTAREARRRVLRDGHPALWPIGTGHGFTPREETSGFMIWNRGKTVLVDPPSSTLNYLRQNGIPLTALDGILLTHGHTDHYGNAVPMLRALKPNLKIYSTPTIFRMLQEQYSLALGEDGGAWNFHPLYPQVFENVLGLHLRPEYGFHPVPAIGFDLYDRPDTRRGKLVVSFTGDTFADHVALWRHTQPSGEASPVMSVARASQILRHRDLLLASKGQRPPPVFLIEGGVPPIHIPPARTRELLDQAELLGVDTSRVAVYHIGTEAAAAARVPKWIAGAEGFVDLSGYFRSRKRR